MTKINKQKSSSTIRCILTSFISLLIQNQKKHWNDIHLLSKSNLLILFINIGAYAPKPSSGPHKQRECLPLIVFIRNRLKYALNGREVQSILMQRLVKVDGKVRTDSTFPAGFMGKSFF